MFRELLKRANLSHIEEFIKSGGELMEYPENKTYNQSVRETEKEIRKLIQTHFKKDEWQKITDIIYRQIDTLESVYFELGLFAGMKIATQIYEKTKEIM